MDYHFFTVCSPKELQFFTGNPEAAAQIRSQRLCLQLYLHQSLRLNGYGANVYVQRYATIHMCIHSRTYDTSYACVCVCEWNVWTDDTLLFYFFQVQGVVAGSRVYHQRRRPGFPGDTKNRHVVFLIWMSSTSARFSPFEVGRLFFLFGSYLALRLSTSVQHSTTWAWMIIGHLL